MDLKEIEEIPRFESDIDPLTLMNMKSEADRMLANSLSKMRQEQRWLSERVLMAYNLSVQNANFIRKYGGPIAGAVWIGSLIIAVIISKLADKIHL